MVDTLESASALILLRYFRSHYKAVECDYDAALSNQETVSMTRYTRSSDNRTRMRRMRSHSFSRELMREHKVSASDLIAPLFVFDGNGTEQAVIHARHHPIKYR